MSLVPTQNEWSVMLEQADMFVRSGLLPRGIDTAQKVVVIMTMGRELGIAPWAALNGINVIQGKPTISPQLMLALINRSGEAMDIQIDDPETIAKNKACAVTMTRADRSSHTEIFTMNMAQAMGLSNKDNWKKQPANMLKWRAIAACARVVFPDVLAGFTYTPEEINPDISITETGEIASYDWQEPVAAIEADMGDDYAGEETSKPKPKGYATTPRPWNAPFLRDALAEKQMRNRREGKTGSITDKQVQKVVITMNELVNDDKERHTLLSYLFDVESTNDLDKAQASAIIDWAETPEAKEEAARVIRQDAVNKGQVDMFADEGGFKYPATMREACQLFNKELGVELEPTEVLRCIRKQGWHKGIGAFYPNTGETFEMVRQAYGILIPRERDDDENVEAYDYEDAFTNAEKYGPDPRPGDST